MPPFFRRTSNFSCFFCQSSISPAPFDPRCFRCPQCSCWNRYDANGEIMSDEPAMHDENLNAKSFAKRASPNKYRLPSAYGKGQFCHTCQTNQMLLVNLLSNYLPSPQHPDYAKRLEQLPTYRDSLHIRYPPVCSSCLPAVEDEIQRKNHMARTRALGAWLQQSRGKDRRRQTSGTAQEREKLDSEVAAWRLRGILWWTTLVCVVASHFMAVLEYRFPRALNHIVPVLPLYAALSLLFTAWDPTCYSFKKARIQGRDVRVQGKTRYIILQLIAWTSRMFTSILLILSWHSPPWDYLDISAHPPSHRTRIYCSLSLVVEILVFTTSFATLHLQKPPSIRLTDGSTHDDPQSSSARATSERPPSRPRFSPQPISSSSVEPDLAVLTLSSKPLVSPTNPVFGFPSLPSLTGGSSDSPIKADDVPGEDAMDWTPTNSSSSKLKRSVDDVDGPWMRPQRFFPPERPTGLETLFANTKLEDGDFKMANPGTHVWTSLLHDPTFAGRCVGALTIILVPLGAICYLTWLRWSTSDGSINSG
ncbi:Ima1 N-terminal domain-containing protein [Phlebopus sp. FC_14]|nr:Ima1 N-terminal domain-containing protein [Phlebopus sp. FC_14]